MAEIPRPSPSRRPPAPPLDEPQTDPGLHAALQRHDNKLTMRSVLVAIGAVAMGTVTAVMFVDNRVQAQVDAGTRVQAAEQKALDTRLQTLEKRFDRFDAKMDLLLDAQRVPAWKRPPPSDGGSP